MLLIAVTLTIVPAFAENTHGTGSSTTLDACGYFVGTQTSVQSKESVVNGVTYNSEKGQWTGVLNNYGRGPVVSLGDVKGSYSLVSTADTAGNISGTESFNSSSGKIEQTFAFSPSTGWTVTVTATRELSFLTSDTNGHCYTGPVPRS